jgi:hypothetical protein
VLLGIALLSAVVLFVAAAKAEAAGDRGSRGAMLARTYLTAAQGGSVKAKDGVELRVPADAMSRNGYASIRQLSDESFDIHIDVPWEGTVTILLPFDGKGKPAVSHRVDGRWIAVPAIAVKGRAQLRVQSLSLFHTDEQLRYGVETMNLAYTDFLARKADFMGKGCVEGSNGCAKPWPYNGFNWTDDGCSPSFIPKIFYRNLFDGPCKQHDFGYRNFGNGLQLGRNDETRTWIDAIFLNQMRHLCNDNFSRVWQILNKTACLEMADLVHAAVRSPFGRAAFYRPVPFPEPGQPAPTPIKPLDPLPQIDNQPLPELQPIPIPPPSSPTRAEQQGSLGANTFTNPYNASDMGVKIQPYQWVEVSCKVYAPQIVSANPDGYWYRVASPPWSNAYYAVANTFWNGDIPGQKPYVHNTDFAVPDC